MKALENTCRIESDAELAMRLGREWHNETVNNDNQYHFNSGKIHVFQKTALIYDDQFSDHSVNEIISIDSDELEIKEKIDSNEGDSQNAFEDINRINDKMNENQGLAHLNYYSEKRKRCKMNKLCNACENEDAIKKSCGH